RLFRPLDSCQQRGRLRDLSWKGGSDAARPSGRASADGMVSGVPPTSGAIPPAERRSLHDGLESAGGSRSGRVRPRPREGLQPAQPGGAGELCDVSQMRGDAGRGARDARSDSPRSLPVHPGRAKPRYWRSFEELAGTPEFERFLRGESSEEILAQASGLDRRDLFRLLGVSFALAGLTACTRQPAEKIVPYVRQPEEVIPGGRPLFFATAMTVSGRATGLLIESHMGRPTKAEGNPLHPASLGASDLYAQASLYGLYDPDRSQTLTYLQEIRPWPAFLGAMRLALEAERPSRGAGLRFLTESVCSPTAAAQMQEIA